MKSKIVYQTDPLGYFVGEVEADPSPLEEGVFIIPGNCVETKPPAPVEGKQARHTGKKWVMEDVQAQQEPSEEELRKQAVAMRQAAYRAESDPLYMEWQFDETDEKKDAWRASVEAIKARYPLP